ncbi:MULTISPECIES: hypothetical protein [unclassified Clostridium]|uniref:hypothetical protein n=1 Tax=unclassified Clostridium TaxID=2614128 RepID=UPI0013D262C2
MKWLKWIFILIAITLFMLFLWGLIQVPRTLNLLYPILAFIFIGLSIFVKWRD